MHEESVTLFRQTAKEGRLAFKGQRGNQYGILTADGFEPRPDSEDLSAQRQSPSTRISLVLLKSLQQTKTDGRVLDRLGESIQILAVLEYVLLSYCYRRFETFPMLWLYAPNQIARMGLFEILTKICFNGYRVYPYDRAGKIRRIVDTNTPMLVFEDIGRYSKWVRGYWLDYPIERNRALGKRKRPLYSPVIVISRYLPPEPYHLHTLEVTLHSQGLGDLGVDLNLQALKTIFLAMAFKIDEVIIDNEPSPESLHPYERQLQTLRELNKALVKCDYLSVETEAEMNTFIDQQTNLAWRQCESFPDLIVEAVATYLDQIPVRQVMRRNENFIALADLIKDLRQHTQVPARFNEWKLSRLLNKKRLIVLTRRQRVNVTENVGAKTREVLKQVTFVRIDETRLNQVIRSRIWKP